MGKLPLGLLQAATGDAGLSRRLLVAFALASAVVNGLVTASVGAWLAQKYAAAQSRQHAIQSLSSLIYERRTKAGMVVSSIRRGADLDEVRHRKRSYDETYIDWNKTIRTNLFAIREAMGERGFSSLEQDFENLLVTPLAQMDACLTRAYDLKVTGYDAKPELETCQMATLYQLTLDCGATFSNELYKMTQIRLLPFTGPSAGDQVLAKARIDHGCKRPILPPALSATLPATPPASLPNPLPISQPPPLPSAMPKR
jgi:hypothetical protein